jgi:hypothetical protein
VATFVGSIIAQYGVIAATVWGGLQAARRLCLDFASNLRTLGARGNPE